MYSGASSAKLCESVLQSAARNSRPNRQQSAGGRLRERQTEDELRLGGAASAVSSAGHDADVALLKRTLRTGGLRIADQRIGHREAIAVF